LISQIPSVEVVEQSVPKQWDDEFGSWVRDFGPLDLVVCDPFPVFPRPLVQQDLSHFFVAAGRTPLVVFAGSEHPVDIRTALACKVAAYIPKSIELGLIGSILQLVRAGGVYVPPCLANQLNEADYGEAAVPSGPHGPLSLADSGDLSFSAQLPEISPLGPRSSADFTPIPSAIAALTKRQRQVLELLSQGLSNADIGAHMSLNLSTVKSHVTGVLRALGVSSRTQAVLLYKQQWPQGRQVSAAARLNKPLKEKDR
jgi:DNA-binding NarL/FixJ family response regulator